MVHVSKTEWSTGVVISKMVIIGMILLLFDISMLSFSHASWVDGDDGSCSTVSDCFGLGDCVEGKCVCDAYARGSSDCSVFSFLPAPAVDLGYVAVLCLSFYC